MIRSMKMFRLVLAAAALPFAFILAPAAVAATVTITDDNCPSFTFDANNQKLTCDSGSPPPAGAPTGCTLTASPSSLQAGGGTVALTASRKRGVRPSYSWTGQHCRDQLLHGQTSRHASARRVSSTTTFSVIATNARELEPAIRVRRRSQPSHRRRRWARFPARASTRTKVIDAMFPANGGASTRLYTYNNIFSSGGPGWGARDAIVVRFTAPAAGDAYMSIAMTATGGQVSADDEPVVQFLRVHEGGAKQRLLPRVRIRCRWPSPAGRRSMSGTC